MADTAPKKPARRVAVIDSETDRFRLGASVRPYVWGFYDGSTWVYFWGDDCTEKLLAFLTEYEEPLVIYAHNGGKFDYKFMVEHLDTSVKIIGQRIVKAFFDKHELRDSYANIPVPLSQFQTTSGTKLKFNHKMHDRENRERYKKNILEYLKQDCVVLYDGIMQYRHMFGDALTMASAAMKKLNEVTVNGPGKAYKRLSAGTDKLLRPFYFGGRVECFSSGIIDGMRRIYDYNSMYPWVMGNFSHPVGNAFKVGNTLDDRTDFAIIDATSRGCLPSRMENGGLHFPHGRGRFFASFHEIKTGLDLGKLTIHKVEQSYACSEKTSFVHFVDMFYTLRNQAKDKGDAMLTLFYKLVMNSAYGKFGQNPERYHDYQITTQAECICGALHKGNEKCPEGWILKSYNNGLAIMARPVLKPDTMRLNVATAASITAAARATLARGIEASTDVIYCDTDSIVCRHTGEATDNKKLGALKLEAEGNRFAIAGKKMYALFGDRSNSDFVNAKRVEEYGDDTCIKLAAKGVRLKAADMLHLANKSQGGLIREDNGSLIRHLNDGVVQWTQAAPQFSLTGKQSGSPLIRQIRANA